MVSGDSLTDAYRNALGHYYSTRSRYLTVHVREPVADAAATDSCRVEDWEDALNLGPYWGDIKHLDYPFAGKYDGTGAGWVSDRIHELHRGGYRDRMRDPDQLEMIRDRLRAGLHGSCTNALVAQVFRDTDLERATTPVPNQQDLSCITQLQFKPTGDKLHLYMTLRSQYLDLKGLGNLASGATMLATMAAETDYEPGHLYETVNNVTLYDQTFFGRLAAELGVVS
jgi:hypothetical protein